MTDGLIAPIEEFCSRKGYEDMLVTVMADGDLITTILQFDAVNDTWVWFDDWYEGQRIVHLVGFVPLSHVIVVDEEVSVK